MSLHLSILQHINFLEHFLVHAPYKISMYQRFSMSFFFPSLDGRPCSATDSHIPSLW